MRVIGMAFIVLASIQGTISLFYFGLVPLVGGVWTWSDYGLSLLIGLVFSIVFYNVGDWFKSKAKPKQEVK